MKMPQYAAVAGGAFREYRNSITDSQRIIDVLIDAGGVAAFCAFDEQRARILAQPSEQRPTADLGFGDETGRAHGDQRIHIQPRNMIGCQHHPLHPGGWWNAATAQSDAEYREQTRRPVLRHAFLRWLTEMRIYRRLHQSGNDVQQ